MKIFISRFTALLAIVLVGIIAYSLQPIEHSDIEIGESNEPLERVELSSNTESSQHFDVEGNLLVPFDIAYNELFESGEIPYEEDTILLKYPITFSGVLSRNMKTAGVESIEVLYSSVDFVWYKGIINENKDIKEVVATARTLSEVLVVDYNYIYETAVEPLDIDFDEVQGNPSLQNQKYLKEFGIQDSWKWLTANGYEAGGSSSVVVAVIDTGVDYNHVDLAANMWVNIDEIPGNNIDDDNNGYVDDIHGVNVISDDRFENGNPMDDHGHGTHVAGIIAAANNKEGVVGVAYNSKIMAIKAGQASGFFTQADIAEAILYAYDNGADVINMSFGGSGTSIAVQDALMTAYTRSVLVASAGNSSLPNENVPGWIPVPNYPAAYSYVIGVMSVNNNGVESPFTNWDVKGYNTIEYEVYAPGEQILSTLPNDTYAAWSGTSMAAPVVSGIAALARSVYSDRDMYPNKFIMGQIVSTSETSASCLNPNAHGLHNIPNTVDALAALTKLPKPEISLYDYLLYDSEEISESNNGDGIIDAGETIDIGLILRNKWGMSKDTIVTIDSISTGGVPNPFVTFITDEVNFEGVGTYSTKDLLSRDGSIVTGVETPHRIIIDSNTPNDYIIVISITGTSMNGLDPDDTETYDFKDKIYLTVRNGMILPNIVEEDMTLTNDNYYIIPNSMIIKEGATVIVEPGTKIQFWTDDPNDAYADTAITYLKVEGEFITQGTNEEPVELFPSELMSQYRVEIYESNNGFVSLNNTEITNSYIDISEANKVLFKQNYLGPIHYRQLYSGKVNNYAESGRITVDNIYDSIFYVLGGNSSYTKPYLSANVYNSILVNSAINISYNSTFENSVFLKNNTLDYGYGYSTSTSLGTYKDIAFREVKHMNFEGKTYVLIENKDKNNFHYQANIEYINDFIELYGGNLTEVTTLEQKDFIKSFMSSIGDTFYSGLITDDKTSVTWSNGNDVDYSLILPDGYFDMFEYKGNVRMNYNLEYQSWNYQAKYYLYELPNSIYIDGITTINNSVDIDMESTYSINATVTPSTADGSELVFVSSDETVITVDESGVVSPVAYGTAKVYIYSDDYQKQTAIEVNVVQKVELVDFDVSIINNQLNVNALETLDVVLSPTNTTQRELFYSSSNPDVASIDSYGNITALGVGNTTIRVENISGELFKELDISVVRPVESIKFEESIYMTSLLATEDSFLPEILPVDATNQLIKWESSNPEVAYVNENNKLVKIKNGVTTLKATIDNTDLVDELIVSVSDSTGTGEVIEMAYYSYYYFALFSDGNIYYWGKDILSPKELILPAEHNIIDFTISSDNLVILNDDKTINTYYIYSYINNGTSYDIYENTFNNLYLETNVEKIEQTSGGRNVFFMKSDGSVWAYGNNGKGELGDSTKTSRTSLVQVLVQDIVDIAAGSGFATFLDSNGNMYVTGGYYTEYTTPTLVNTNILSISSTGNDDEVSAVNGDAVLHYYHYQNSFDQPYRTYNTNSSNAYYTHYGLFIQDENGIFVQGSNDFGELGNGVTSSSNPSYMLKISDMKEVFSFDDFIYVQTMNGKFYGMGKNTSYQLGNFSNVNSSVPSRIFFGLVGNEGDFTIEDSNVSTTLYEDTITLNFNEALVTGENYVYITLSNNNENLAILKNLNLDKVEITPFNGWIVGETYTLTIPSNAVTTKFMEPNTELIYTFTYVGDQTAMSYVSQSIEDNHSFTDNEVSIDIEYTFLKEGLNYSQIKVIDISDSSEQDISVSIMDNQLQIDGVLDYGSYKLIVPAEALQDNLSGTNNLLEINFDVLEVIKVIDNSHPDNSSRKMVEDDIVITFSNAIASTNFSNIALYDVDNNVITSEITLVDNVLRINPNDPLIEGSYYTVYIPNDAVVDSLGNVNDEINNTFKTYEPLSLLRTSITSGDSSVNPTQRITLYYNYAVSSTAFELITITNQIGDPVDYTIVLENNQLHIDLNVEFNESYILTIPEGSLKDELGILNNEHIIQFETVSQTERFYYTSEILDTMFDQYLNDGLNTVIKNSAILNNFNDTNVEHWLRFVASNGEWNSSLVETIGLGGNFWGTTNLELINKQILDFDDYQSMYNINEGIILTTAPENTFPFVTNVEVINSAGESVQKVGNETIQVVVEFNRDMDMTVPLDVRFGSSLPYAEYQIEGTYENPRKWVGVYTLTTVIENGNQFFSITNGHAVEDSWFSLQPDRARFTFEIDTTGAQALIMQGVSTETGIELNWTQDDFETLAGYNVYRSTSEDGYYQRLNDVVIPSSVKTFFDDTVEPGVIYYYNFTVVKTDLTESIPSGKIVIQSLDTMAPNIYHSPVYQTLTGHNLVISASITDNLFVNSAYLHYRTIGDTEWNTVSMTNNNDKYSGVIISEEITLDGLEYYISASDGITVTYNRTSENPYQVIVKQSIDSSKLGDINDDGQITILDALMHLQATNDQLNLTADEFLRADLDGNGQLEAWEALRILQYVSGKVTTIK